MGTPMITAASSNEQLSQFPEPSAARVLPSLQCVTPSAVSEQLPEFPGCPISCPCLLVALVLNQGPFPPSTLLDFPGTTGLSVTPSRPARPSRVAGWSCARPRNGVSRVASAFLLSACRRHYPGGTTGCFSLASPVTAAFPVYASGRLPHYPFRGLLSVHSRYGLHTRRVPYRTLYTRGFNRFVTSTAAPVATGRSESCRAGFAPAERQRLNTAHT